MRKWLGLVIAICFITAFCSWGFLIHRTINQLAVYELPKTMRPFFYKNMRYLVKESVRPDERRNTDKTEASKHFIDFEAYGDSAAWKAPWNWEEAVQKYSKDTLEEYGYVPYVIIDVQAKLTEAFRQKNRDSILFYAADLGHYIGDIHTPLHTSLNYDGQLTGQKGLHSLWESTVPELELKNYTLSSRHKATYLKTPQKQLWAALRNSFTLTATVFSVEKEVTKNFTPEQKYRTQTRNGKEVKSYTTAFAKAYGQALGNMVNNQLIASADLLADLWYTSWVDGGKPDLNALLTTPYTKADRKALYAEVKLFKKNELLKKDSLISRKSQTTTTE